MGVVVSAALVTDGLSEHDETTNASTAAATAAARRESGSHTAPSVVASGVRWVNFGCPGAERGRRIDEQNRHGDPANWTARAD